jgi:azurin
MTMTLSRRSLMRWLWAAPLVVRRAVAAPPKLTELYVASDGDEMAFVPDRLGCATGAAVRLHFRHRGQIIDDPHDWVLLKPGSAETFLADADRQPDGAPAVPAQDRPLVLAATPLCAKGRSVSVRFIAPAPGDYPFVCAVPGHGRSMHGILRVDARSSGR